MQTSNNPDAPENFTVNHKTAPEFLEYLANLDREPLEDWVVGLFSAQINAHLANFYHNQAYFESKCGPEVEETAANMALEAKFLIARSDFATTEFNAALHLNLKNILSVAQKRSISFVTIAKIYEEYEKIKQQEKRANIHAFEAQFGLENHNVDLSIEDSEALMARCRHKAVVAMVTRLTQ